MSDFTDSLRSEDDSDIKKFVLEMFDRVDSLHERSEHEFEQAYYQGKKDALRIVLAQICNNDVDTISGSSIVAYKLRGDLPLDDGTYIKRRDE